MPRSYSITEARSSLPAIVDQAEAGGEIELTRRGKPVAVVVSVREMERLRDEQPRCGAAYRRFLETCSLADIGLDEDFAASARARGAGRDISL